MKNIILILSYLGKAAGFLGTLTIIPGVDARTGVIIFFVASLVKDTANRLDDFLTANYLTKPAALIAIGLIPASLVLMTGCASDGSLTPQAQAVLTKSEAVAWTIAGVYETANTATGGALTTSLLNKALTDSHNTPDITQADAAAKLAEAAINAQLAARKAGADAAAQQAAVTKVLSDPVVIANVAKSATP